MNIRVMVAASSMLISGAASGQAYPNRPIHITPGQPAGGGYIQMLAIRDLLASRLGQPIVLDAMPANLMGGTVARAKPDGYTLMAAGDTVWFAPLLSKMDYDTLKDFSPVTGLTVAPLVLVVNPSLPVNSVKELIALAKTKPGALNYSSAAVGSSYFLSGELFKSMAGVNIMSVPYTGAGPTIQAVLSGEVQLTFAPTATVVQFIKSGKLKALAHTAPRPTPLVHDLPSIADAGLPGYEFRTVNALFAPAKTPAAIVRRLNEEFHWAMAQSGVTATFVSVGAEPYPTTPQELATAVKTKYAAVAKLIKNAGIVGK